MRARSFALVLALLPTALAAGGAYEHEDSTSGTRFTGSTFVQYRMTLDAGQQVEATLTWTDPDAWFELSYFDARSGCPGPLDEAVENCVRQLDPCPRSTSELPGALRRDLSFTVEESGINTLNVEPHFVLEPTPYRITITVDGAAAPVFEVRHRDFGPPLTDAPCYLD